ALVTSTVEVGCEDRELTILLILFDSTGGLSWHRKEGWNAQNKNLATWYGVTVEKMTGRVAKLDLSSNNLCGE
ncbi:unnamed protein product, partial [Choristocarpus tenellus]